MTMAETALETITCPDCKRALQVPASYFGQTVQCPECRHQFVAKSSSVQSTPPSSSRPAPERDYDDEPQRRRRNEYDGDDNDDAPHIHQSGIPHRGGLILAM